MHRAILALAIVLAAAAPSFGATKAKGHHMAKAKVHHVAKPKAAKAESPNANTGKLFANMFK